MTGWINMLRLSCDDGCSSDVRVAELAKKYDVDCVFYWPVEHRSLAYDNGYEPLSTEDQFRIAGDFEIGSHTLTHRHLTKLDDQEAIREIRDSRLLLQNTFSQAIDKFCPPRGYTNKLLTDITLKIYKSQRLTKGSGLVHVHPNSGANDNHPWRLRTHEIIAEELWMHSWELDKYNLWDELEEFLSENSHS